MTRLNLHAAPRNFCEEPPCEVLHIIDPFDRHIGRLLLLCTVSDLQTDKMCGMAFCGNLCRVAGLHYLCTLARSPPADI